MCESDAPRPPGLVRALWILTRMGLRRRFARVGHAFSKLRKKSRGSTRGPTLRKRPRGALMIVFFGAIMLWNAGFLSNQFLQRHEEAFPRVERHAIVEAARAGELGWPRHAIQRLEAALRPILIETPDGLDDEEREDFEARFSREAWFDRTASLVEEGIGPEADVVRRRVCRERDAGVALLMIALAFAIFLSQLGARNQDLGQVETSFAWLFTFPVSSRAIFLSKILEYALGDFFSWCIFTPFLFVVGLRAGAGFAAVPLAIVGAFYLNLLLASLQVGIETWLRKRLGPARRKNLQGAFSLLGILILMGGMGLALAPAGPGLLYRAAAFTGAWVAWIPPALPLRMFGGGDALAAGLAMIGVAGVVAAGGLAWVVGLVSAGLDAEAGAYRGARGKRAGTIAPRRSLVRGVVGKDLKLLWRDRNLFVQSLIVPAVIVGFQIVVNPKLFETLSSSFDHIPAIAFGLGAYILMFSAAQSLAVEGNALWLLLATPARLDRVILGKAALWGVFSALLPTGLMVWAAIRAPELTAMHLAGAAFALVGIFVYAVIAAGMGALATDVLEQEVKRRMRPAVLYLFMLLASLYALALYAPGLSGRFAVLVLCTGLAFAVWQKFKDGAPYLLDPDARPPKRIGLAHGIVAALVFFTVQSIVTAVLLEVADLRPSAAILNGYLAGSVVLILGATMYAASSDREHDAPMREAPPTGFFRSCGGGIAIGLAAAGAGCAWLLVIHWVEPLRALRDAAVAYELSLREDQIRILVLSVVLAPLVEEFLFRRLIYRTMRRAVGFGFAALLSTAMFTVVHPPISMLPVFVLGLAAAYIYERTGRLVAPILAHAVYNAVVVGGSIWLG